MSTFRHAWNADIWVCMCGMPVLVSMNYMRKKKLGVISMMTTSISSMQTSSKCVLPIAFSMKMATNKTQRLSGKIHLISCLRRVQKLPAESRPKITYPLGKVKVFPSCNDHFSEYQYFKLFSHQRRKPHSSICNALGMLDSFTAWQGN